MNENQLSYFREKLQEEKKALVSQITGLENSGLHLALGDSIGELSLYDNHPGDVGDELFERSKDLALRGNAHVLLERVEAALGSIKSGTYGTCDECLKGIPLARLEVAPWASKCIQCQRHEDDGDQASRPLEEALLTPPFKRTFLDDDPNDFVGFDGEDALQAVLRYGSSDSPQDLPGTHDYEDLIPNHEEQQGIVEPGDAIPNHSYRQVKTEK